MDSLEELSLLDFSRMNIASPTSSMYAAERRKIMGQSTQSTKLIQSKLDNSTDSITFYFLTEATEKYGPSHNFKDVNPNQGFNLELDPSKTYEIHLRFEGVSSLAKAEITVQACKSFLWNTDFAIWSNSPSFHWQGFNYNLSQLDAAIYPTSIAPKKWDKVHGEALIDKHLIDLFIHVKFFMNQMASSLFNKVKTMKVNTAVSEVQESIREKEAKTPYSLSVDSVYKGKRKVQSTSVAKAVTIPQDVPVDIYILPQKAGESFHFKVLYDDGRYETDVYYDSKMEALRDGWDV